MKRDLQEIWSLVMKVIDTVHKLLFFKTTDIYTMGTKIWKNSWKLILKNFSEYICKQLKYQWNEVGISRGIILNVFKWLTVSLFIAFSANLLCCQICTFYCPLGKKGYNVLLEGTDLHIWQHIHQKDWTLCLPLY